MRHLPDLRLNNMSLRTELEFTGEPNYKDAAPTALPKKRGGYGRFHLHQAVGFAGVTSMGKIESTDGWSFIQRNFVDYQGLASIG